MLVFHRTTPAAAQSIRLHGFLDGRADALGADGAPTTQDGVLFSDRPPHMGEDSDQRTVLAVELPFEDVDTLRRFEWPDPDHRAVHREWLIPARWVNVRAIVDPALHDASA